MPTLQSRQHLAFIACRCALSPVIFLTLTTSNATQDSSPQTIATAPPLWVSTLAILPLLLTAMLAFQGEVRATAADRATLLCLAFAATICFWTPARKYFERATGEAHNAATFALASAMFVIYSLARRAGPEAGFSLQFAILPDDKFVVPYAAMIVVAGALVMLPFGFKTLGGITRAWLIGAAILGVLALGSLRLLSAHYKIGVTETLDPTPLVHIVMQLIEYSSLAILCAVATASVPVRAWLLRVLPIVLLAMWARHQFAPPPPIVEEDE